MVGMVMVTYYAEVVWSMSCRAFLSFKVLGDSAYPNNDFIVSVYKGHHLPPASAAFNAVMCPIRTCVEWGYEKIV